MTLIWVGFAIEAIGLGLTGTGLFQTWRSNSADRDFLPAPIRRSLNWVRYALLRRPRPVISVTANAVLGPFEMVGHVTAKQTFGEYMTIDQKVNIAQANALAALESAAEARSAIRDEVSVRTKSETQLTERIAGTERQVTEFARSLVLDGIPVAVFGLGLTAVGLFVQTVASALSVS